MMMKMLEAGGMRPITDGDRTADVDNPKGYYEYERVKDLEKEPDRSWVREARGKALKVISLLLRTCPTTTPTASSSCAGTSTRCSTSQNKMLDRLGNAAPGADMEAMKEAYRNDIVAARLHARKQPNMELLEVHYFDAVEDPDGTARLVNPFLGGGLDEAAMAAAVNKSLYRNRA